MFILNVIALSEFFAQNFPHFWWYPYWYLGNPYHFLIGPVIPVLLGVTNIVGFIKIYEGYMVLILVSNFLGGVGIYHFLRNWRVEKRIAIAALILYIVCPISYLLLPQSNGLHHIVVGLLPFVFLVFKQTLQDQKWLRWIFFSLCISFLLLVEVSVFLPLVVGIVALFLSVHVKDKEESIVKIILSILLGISLATFWYTPSFWWTLFVNPSIGGAPLFQLIKNLSQFILQLLPLALAILVVKWRSYKPQGIYKFAALFFVSFLFLSVIRFLADPDFILDWIGFGLELQLGLSILLGGFLGKLFKNRVGKIVLVSFLTIVILFDCYIAQYIFQQYSPLRLSEASNSTIQQSNSYQTRITSLLKKYVGEDERVFLSGSPVFFVNSKLNVMQVRGGVDEASIHPWWRHASYQIREGRRSDITIDWLKAFGTSYVLVHSNNSDEPFRDFKNVEKYKNVSLIKEDKGELLYKVEQASIARMADKEILRVQTPLNGADLEALGRYVQTLKLPVRLSIVKPNVLSFKTTFKTDEVLSLAVTYDKNWKITKGNGKIKRDSLGNIVIVPDKLGIQDFELQNQRPITAFLIPSIFSVLLFASFWKFELLYSFLKKRFPKVSFGLHEEE